ncbi:MAG: hypothetical protein J7K90_13190 [Desulfuromusa sp.]|nr:hypothetical protein [Desulfuromusa sp.]
MEKQELKRRIVYPVLTVMGVMVISYIGYFGSRQVSNNGLHQVMAELFGATLFLSISLGTIYVYMTAYLRGASLIERILASLVVPFIWMTKEVWVLTESHPFLQCLYWYFNPLNFLLVSQVVMEMGVATLLARMVLKKRGVAIRVLSPVPLAFVFGGLGLGIISNVGGNGELLYVTFLEGYRLLFGSGL